MFRSQSGDIRCMFSSKLFIAAMMIDMHMTELLYDHTVTFKVS